MKDYSQHGEGRIIANYFAGFTGTLISLGENDGKTLSNVLGLIQSGWTAHLVEPSKKSFDKLQALHENNLAVRCYNYAIAGYDGKIDFYESGEHLGSGDHSLLSTTNPGEISRWKGTAEFKKTTVPCKTFDSFLKEAHLKHFYLISIDCEGVDLEILRQIDFGATGTQAVIVETNSVKDDLYIGRMKTFGFKVLHKNYCNLIFVR